MAFAALDGFDPLLAAARQAVNPVRLDSGEGELGAVGAALGTFDGRVFTGVSLHLPCGLGFCAEVNAAGQMVTAGGYRIARIVATTAERILVPCGRCRETLVQLDPSNLEASVLVAPDRAVLLRELLPLQWQAEARLRSEEGM